MLDKGHKGKKYDAHTILLFMCYKTNNNNNKGTSHASALLLYCSTGVATRTALGWRACPIC